MRQLASYALSTGPVDRHPSATRDEVSGQVDEWLASKGKPTEAGNQLALHDGRLATIDRNTTASTKGSVSGVEANSTTGGWFRTSIAAAESADTLAVSVGLSAGSSSLSPISLDVHCPRIIRTLLASPVAWMYGATRLTAVPANFSAAAGGDAFINTVWSAERSVPLVAISDEHGAVLHPGIVEALAGDLAGLAIVARLDPAAS